MHLEAHREHQANHFLQCSNPVLIGSTSVREHLPCLCIEKISARVTIASPIFITDNCRLDIDPTLVHIKHNQKVENVENFTFLYNFLQGAPK